MMFSFGALTFLSPWVLAALLVVPALWWLLRVMPPQPKSIRFPGYFLMKDLRTDIKTASKTPWWLLLLRSAILALFILALADPVMKLSEGFPGSGGAVLVTVDNGWASAANWKERQAKLREILPRIKRGGRSVIFLPTAPSAGDGKLHYHGPMDAEEAENFVARLAPQPWPTDHGGLRAVAAEVFERNKISHAIFLSDGTASDRNASHNLLRALQSDAGGLTVVMDGEVNAPLVLRRTVQKPGQLSFSVERLEAATEPSEMKIVAAAAGGNVLDELAFSYPGSRTSFDVTWDILPEMRNKVARLYLREPQMASAVYLTDSQWQQHPVGVIADPSQKDNQSFLNEVYYLRRALETNSQIDVDQVDELLKQPLSALIWPDSAPVAAVERVRLLEWVQQGGFLIRFAGPNLAANPEDPLLPVALRYGQRAMEGSMTWEKPVKLGDIGEFSPLLGLGVPKDVTVTRQVLADPSPEVFEKTWLQLEDGTPLVTGGSVGKGVIVLVHTTAGPDWSNFSYSGLYVEALRRMISLSTGIGDYKAKALLPPLMVMDGFGRLTSPDPKSVVKSADAGAPFVPSPETPPGIYGDERQFQVFNLGDGLPAMQALQELPAGVLADTYALTGERSQKADLFKWALLLLMLDAALTMWLRGVVSLQAKTAALFVLLFFPVTAQAAEATDLASNVYLAYLETGDQGTDEVSFNGLKGLAEIINARTTIKVKGVVGVNPEIDDLFYYPFIYWPVAEAQGGISADAARRIQNYMGRGGMIVFDTRDQQFGDTQGSTIGQRKLRQLTENIRIPELMTVPDDHILTRSFYLLDDFPGVYAGGKVWVEKEPNPNYDAVTSVIIGANDWAAAWSKEASDRSRFMLPGGEQQREMAYRSGVNIIMVALAGNYKADQVHVPYILERLKR